MDYKKKYEEALERARKLKENPQMVFYEYSPEEGDTICDYIFPELKESEDEKVRKEIVRFIQMEVEDEIVGNKWLAWLEKQGEHKPVVIIPKFRIGDNIKTTNEEPLTITKIDGKGYWSEDLFICGFDDAAKWELVEQKPVWSEEDEIGWTNTMIMIKEVASHHYTKDSIKLVIDWLKSLKE